MSKDKDKPMQWHPLFAELLRPLLQDFYDVQVNVPVGDVPREADILLLRRTYDGPTPFHGFLHHLTTWNILEFKGRSVSARIRDLDLLVEVGLGLDRRLNEERGRQDLRALDPSEVSFWYIVNHFGKRFLHQARQRLGAIEEAGPGVWRSQILLRPLFLIDGRAVPVERDSVPLHLVGEESREIEEALARIVVEESGFWERYSALLGLLHPNIIEEANRMAATRGKRGDLDLRPFIEKVGLKKILAAVEVGDAAVGDAIDTFGPKRIAKVLGMERYLASLTVEERKQLKELLR